VNRNCCYNFIGEAKMTKIISELIKDWTDFWNTYDMNLINDLFLGDSRLTYFSSEKTGLLKGIEEIKAHHQNFGFIGGGKETNTKLWLEDINIEKYHKVVIVTAIWYFKRDVESKQTQEGPVTIVLTPIDDQETEYRIAHMHFANY
jgi:ketosteroid isomerase-like protein